MGKAAVGILFELLYLFLVALAPLPQLHLFPTLLITSWSWTLAPSRLLFPAAWNATSTSLSGIWPYILLLAIAFLALAALHLFAVRWIFQHNLIGANSSRSTRWFVLLLVGSAIFGVTLLMQPALFSDDVFRYIFSGRMLTVYHVDPMTTAPAQFPHDPFLSWISQPGTPNVYGPLWLTFSSLLVRIGGSPLTTLLFFKAVTLVLHLLNCVLIWAILGKIAPARRMLGTLLYAWNPLVLIEMAGNGRNEAVLVFLLLLATWLHVQGKSHAGADKSAVGAMNRPLRGGGDARRGRFIAPTADLSARQPLLQKAPSVPHTPSGRRERWFEIGTLTLFGLAMTINFVALLAAAMYIWFVARPYHGIASVTWNAAWRVLFMLAPVVLLYVPFWHGGSTYLAITSSMNIEPTKYSFVNMLATPLRDFFNFLAQISDFHSSDVDPIPAANAAVLGTTIFIFALIYFYLLGKVRKAPATPAGMKTASDDPEMQLPGFDILLTSWGVALVGYVLLVLGTFWPSFILWSLWVAALRRFDMLSVSIVLLSYTALFIYPLLNFGKTPVAVYAPIFILGIPLIYILLHTIRRTERNRLFYGR